MKTKIFDLQGEEGKEIQLPEQFEEEIREDVIRRAVYVLQSSRRQPYGSQKYAGMKHPAYVSKKRRDYKTSYGHGISRSPRKIMSRSGTRFYWVGANVPFAVGGRRAHPPKPEKIWTKKINYKEHLLAVRSGISASTNIILVKERHNFDGKVPIIFDNEFEKLKKTKDVVELFGKIGLTSEIERTKERKVRSGKGKMRNRKYKKKVGPLVIFAKDNGISKAVRNIPGFEAVNVKKLDAELLSPGGQSGRLTIWSEDAIKTMEENKLYR